MFNDLPKETTRCQDCGSEFEFQPFLFGKTIIRTKTCDPCDVKREEAKLAAQKKKDAEAAAQAREDQFCAKVPALYRDSDPSRLPREPFTKAMSWQRGPQGLLLIGPSGACKTRIAAQLLRRLWFEERITMRCYFGLSFAHSCARKFFDGTGEDWIEEVVNADVVFFDDLGKFKLTERVESELFGVIEMRTGHQRPIIATSNLDGAGMTAKLSADRGEPMVRRLREFCETITCP